MQHNNLSTPTVLTIAGSDSYGGAGVELDTKCIHSLGGYALRATTALTAQNSRGVAGIEPTCPSHFSLLLDTLLSDIEIDAVKIGMLANREIIEAVNYAIDKYSLKNIVLDTVLISSSGAVLLEDNAIESMIVLLFPRATLITPNIPESQRLLGGAFEHKEIACRFADMGAKSTLLKGGHLSGGLAIDYLLQKDSEPIAYSTNKINTNHTHGTGCLLSSAIATYLAKGNPISQSIQSAKNFLTQKLIDSAMLRLKYRDTHSTKREPIF